MLEVEIANISKYLMFILFQNGNLEFSLDIANGILMLLIPMLI